MNVTTILPQAADAKISKGWQPLYRLGGAAALLQLVAIIAYAIVIGIYGDAPDNAAEFFALQEVNRMAALLGGDFLFLLMLAMYLVTFPALYLALRRINPAWVLIATISTIVAVTVSFAGEPTLALLHLGDRYAAATSDAQRAIFLAAGEAVLAGGWWTSSAALLAGILMQGGGLVMSIIMWRSPAFSRVTAASGAIGNGLDLCQHLITPFAPALGAILKMVMGIFYIPWLAMLGRDLLRLGRHGTSGGSLQ